MNNPKTFKILYYLCFIVTLLPCFIASLKISFFANSIQTPLFFMLGIINLILVIIFSILLIKKKINKTNILFPIIYLLFLILVIIIAFIYNNKLIIPYIHFNYYISFILFNYLLLNIYSLLSIPK